jgi:hypothetical protein
MLTREEKRKLVIELYKKDVPLVEISRQAHMSLRDVSEIIQEYDPTKRKLSPRIKALNLFGEGKTILEVMTALNMPYEEAKIVEEQHLAIQNRPKAAKLYKECENKDYLDSILKLYSLLMVNKVNIEELDDLILFSRSTRTPEDV